jgi:PPK2 family polyphosphate:nucleotide phosphotransferase
VARIKPEEYARPYRVTDGGQFRLKDVDPTETRWAKTKQQAATALQHGVEVLSELQERLYAQDRWALLLIFQAMDAAGKDSTIKHVMSGVNPQGCQVYSFKAPTAEELDHDYMWRAVRNLPERGRIGIFNRSYYEETLVVRVHPELLDKQKLPRALVTADIWTQRYEDINNFERFIARNGYVALKFFLHVSKGEQKKRFLSRLDEPAKNWKFSLADAREREYWDEYMNAYEDTIRNTASEHAPWYVVPADHKWFMRLVVAAAVIDALQDLDLQYPVIDAGKQHELEAVRHTLEGQNGPLTKAGKGKKR